MSSGESHFESDNSLHVANHFRNVSAMDSETKRKTVSVRSRRKSRSSMSRVELTTAEILQHAKGLREKVIWNLREDGYSDREIADLLGITKQRISQIERRLILRATTFTTGESRLMGTAGKLRWRAKRPVRKVTNDDFARRLAAVNNYYEARFQRILKRGYNRQKLCTRAENSLATTFWKVWPLIEVYDHKPFSYSRLAVDFPALAKQAHLPQLLSRLRKKGLLRTVGSVRIEGQNLPEVLMAQTPWQEFVAPSIEKLVAKWAGKLGQMKSTYRANPGYTLESIRSHLIEKLIRDGHSLHEIEGVFRGGQVRNGTSYQRPKGDSGRIESSLGSY